MRNRGALIAGGGFVVILLYCLLVPIFSPYDPDAVNFAIAKQDPSLAHLVRHGQVRARPVRAHGSRRPRLDPDRVRRHDRDPRDRRRLRVDLRLRRRPARQRSDALSRRALRASVPALRDHHAGDHRHHEQVDDDDRALDRKLVHDGAHRPRPGDQPEGERLRAGRKAVGARWYRVLVRHLLPTRSAS